MSKGKKKRGSAHTNRHTRAPIPAATEMNTNPHPNKSTMGSIWFLPATKAVTFSKEWWNDNLISVLGMTVNFLTLVVLIYTLLSYQVSNAITQKSLDFTRKTWQISRLPFLGVKGFVLLPEQANGDIRITYTVVNDTDNPAIITAYGIYPYPTKPNVLAASKDNNEKDWISPHAERPRVFTFFASGSTPEMNKFMHDELMSGRMEINLKITAEDIYHDSLVFSYIFKYRDDYKAFAIIRSDVAGLPEEP